jgi:hypothetical protein
LGGGFGGRGRFGFGLFGSLCASLCLQVAHQRTGADEVAVHAEWFGLQAQSEADQLRDEEHRQGAFAHRAGRLAKVEVGVAHGAGDNQRVRACPAGIVNDRARQAQNRVEARQRH